MVATALLPRVRGLRLAYASGYRKQTQAESLRHLGGANRKDTRGQAGAQREPTDTCVLHGAEVWLSGVEIGCGCVWKWRPGCFRARSIAGALTLTDGGGAG